MKVVLLHHTPDPEYAVCSAARNCYSARDIEDISEGWTPETAAKMIAKVRDAGHTSTFEHASFSFGISGVSRALTHQLVRHRHMSPEQRSQRYLAEKGQFGFVIPPTVFSVLEADVVFDEIMREIADAYHKLVALGIPPEDARFVLPNAAETQIVVTANARALLDFFTLRCCQEAQWEIRELAFRMLRLVKRVAPNLFDRAGASCVRGYCNEPNGPQCPRYILITNPVEARRKADTA